MKTTLVFKSVVRFFDHSKQTCLAIAFSTCFLLLLQVSYVFHRKQTCSLALWDRILVLDFVRTTMFSNLYSFTYNDVASFRCFLSFLSKSYQHFSFTAYFQHLFFFLKYWIVLFATLPSPSWGFFLDLKCCFMNLFISFLIGLEAISTSGEHLCSGTPDFTSSLVFRPK